MITRKPLNVLGFLLSFAVIAPLWFWHVRKTKHDQIPRNSAISVGINDISATTTNQTRVNAKTLVVYSHYESRDINSSSSTSTSLARFNLDFFVRVAVLGPNAPEQRDVTFLFIINGETLTVNIPTNMSHVVILKRKNIGLEFCGVVEALKNLPNLETYAHFILLNGSTRGPFVPSWYRRAWPYIFTEMLNDQVKLVGLAINCYQKSKLHVQSFFLATDRRGLDIIMPRMICSNDKITVIEQTEVGMTQAVLHEGYNIACTMQYWKDHDFRDLNSTEKKCSIVPNDIFFANAVHAMGACGFLIADDQNCYHALVERLAAQIGKLIHKGRIAYSGKDAER
eukprot:gene339-621_t